MIDLSIFLDFYFTSWLFIASAFYGVCQLVKMLLVRRWFMFMFNKEKRIIYRILEILDCDCISDYIKLSHIKCLLNSYIKEAKKWLKHILVYLVVVKVQF